jgi:hypothetical protein
MPTRTSRAKHQRHSATQWQTWLYEFTISGLSQSEFCRRKGLTLSAFYNWRKKLGQIPIPAPTSLPKPFIEIKPPSAPVIAPDTSSAAAWDLELELGYGRVLRLRVS